MDSQPTTSAWEISPKYLQTEPAEECTHVMSCADVIGDQPPPPPLLNPTQVHSSREPCGNMIFSRLKCCTPCHATKQLSRNEFELSKAGHGKTYSLWPTLIMIQLSFCCILTKSIHFCCALKKLIWVESCCQSNLQFNCEMS